MANRQKICKGQKSDSSCTCNFNYECQDDTNAPKHDNNNDTTPAYNKQNNECSSECNNCKLLNRLYILLEEIVANRKSYKNTEETKQNRFDNEPKMSLKSNSEETPKIKENRMSLRNNDIDYQKSKINVCNNNTGSNKLTFCNCDKTLIYCTNKEEHIPQVPKTNEANKRRSSAQDWHSVGEVKKHYQVDIACQCTCLKKDSSTQDDDSIPEEKNIQCNKKVLKKCDCMDSTVNTDTHTQNNSCIQNLVCSLSNDPMFREAMKLMHSPNVVVLSNGCSCCNKCNTPKEKISVTTNTSDIIIDQQEVDTTQINQDRLRGSIVTFPKNIVTPREPSIANNDYGFVNPASFMKTRGSNSSSRGSKDIPRQSVNNNDILNDTTFMVPEETDFTVASALVPKSGKKKATPKSKKRKSKVSADSKESDPTDKKDLKNICCQTDNSLIEERCEYVLQNSKKIKDTGTCCEMYKCNVSPSYDKNSMKNPATKNQNANSCNCTDIRNFVAVITELCAQMSKIKENPNEIAACECIGQHTFEKTLVAPNVTPVASDDCLEIHRLAEKIADIHLKSNQNKSASPNSALRNDYRRSVELAKSANSDCDLTNCINLNSVNIASDNTEECYCKICPCKKTTKHDRKDMCPAKKEKRGRYSINTTPKRATKKLNELELANLNKWTQQYPSTSPQKCACCNNECTEETEIECLNYNISDYSKDADNCQMETCPQLRRIVKDCLCGTKNCYCHNEKLNEMKTTAKLERLADEVINTITPCNCSGQPCTCTNNAMDPESRRYTTRQVCFSSIYHENQQKIANITGKEQKLFDKDVNGNPCLNGSKSETKLYIKKLLNTKPNNQNKVYLKKVIPSSAKKLKSLTMKPLLPIPDTPYTQINCIKSLFPEIYQALSKIKQLTNWESLPQEIVEIVIDKILKREIKNALQHMRGGVFKINANDAGDNKNNTNILNILLEDKMKSNENDKEFKNNILDKRSEETKQTTQHSCCKETYHETINLMEDSNNNIQGKFDQKNFDTNKKPILVQINIEKQSGSRKCNTSSISLSEKKNKKYIENSCVSLNENASSSSIYITENKLGSIKNLTLENNNNNQNWEDDTDASSTLSVKEANQPISININIQMEKERKLNLKDSFMNTGVEIPKSIPSLSEENINENTQTSSSKEMEKSNMELEEIRKLMDKLQEKKKSMDDLQKKKKSMDDLQGKTKSMVDLQEKKKLNVDFQETNCLLYHRNRSELPSLEDFMAMNRKMKVKRIKILPKNINKTK